MNEGIKKFAELMKTEEVQDKIRKAMEAYQGEKTPEAVFNNVLTPIANEYGITATYEELNVYFEEAAKAPASAGGTAHELSDEELKALAGGSGSKGGGLGGTLCLGVGFGAGGGAGKEGGGVCALLGDGWGFDHCVGEGETECVAFGGSYDPDWKNK